MQTTWAYPAVFTELDGEIVVRFPDIPEAVTGGDTMEEARTLAADALEEAILGYLAAGSPIPAPRKPGKSEEAVPLDPLTAGRAAVANLMAKQHISKVALANLIQRDEKVVRRILGGAGVVTMENVTTALKALGARPALAVDVSGR